MHGTILSDVYSIAGIKIIMAIKKFANIIDSRRIKIETCIYIQHA